MNEWTFLSVLLRRIREIHSHFSPCLIFWSIPHLLSPPFIVWGSFQLEKLRDTTCSQAFSGSEKKIQVKIRSHHNPSPDTRCSTTRPHFEGLIKNRPSETWKFTLHYWLHHPGSLLPLIGSELHWKRGASWTLIHARPASGFWERKVFTPEPLRSKSYLGQQWHFPFWNSRPNASKIGAH